MKKFLIFLLIALLGGSVAGERIRTLLLEGFAFFSHTTQGVIFQRSVPLREDADNVPVIGKRLNGFASVLLTAAGENFGIKKGDRVITREGEYVGHIEHVSSHISQIVLATHPGERFSGWLPVLSAPIELEGWGSGLLRALVPASFPIKVGDEVWYDARLDAFVGDVISVKDMPGLKEILVRLAVNPLMLSSVRVTHP